MIERIIVDAGEDGMVEIKPRTNVAGKVVISDMTLDFVNLEPVVGMMQSWRLSQRVSLKLECADVDLTHFGQLPPLEELLRAHAIVSAADHAERNR